MGQVKELQLESEGMDQVAEEIAIRAGVLKKCDICEGVYDAFAEDLEVAQVLARDLIQKKDPLVAMFVNRPNELMRRLKDIRSDYISDCDCRRAEKEDH